MPSGRCRASVTVPDVSATDDDSGQLDNLGAFPVADRPGLGNFWGGLTGRLLAVPGVMLLIGLDAVDGVVARSRQETTLLGSVLDIAADRAVEIVLWVLFAYLHLVPLAVPLIFIVRGALTDSVRAVGYAGGKSAHVQLRSRWGTWLVASWPMRGGYGLVKALAFLLLTATLALQSAGLSWWQPVWTAASGLSGVAKLLCIVRGLPVVLDAFRWEQKKGL